MGQTQGAVLLEEVLGPDDAVDGLGRCVPYGAAWKSLLRRFRLALVALGQTLRWKEQNTVRLLLLPTVFQPGNLMQTFLPTVYLFDDCDLPEVPSCAALYERDVCCQAHPVDVITSR